MRAGIGMWIWGRLQGGNRSQRPTGHGLQVAVLTLGAVDDLVDFLLLPGPLSRAVPAASRAIAWTNPATDESTTAQ